MMSVDDCMRAAFAALLRGDTDERDRLCRQAEGLMRAGERLRSGGPLIEGEAIQIPDIIALPDLSGAVQ